MHSNAGTEGNVATDPMTVYPVNSSNEQNMHQPYCMLCEVCPDIRDIPPCLQQSARARPTPGTWLSSQWGPTRSCSAESWPTCPSSTCQAPADISATGSGFFNSLHITGLHCWAGPRQVCSA